MTNTIPAQVAVAVPSSSYVGPEGLSYTFSPKVVTTAALVAEPKYSTGQNAIVAAFFAVTAANAVLPQLPVSHSQWIPIEKRSSSRKKFSTSQRANYDAGEIVAMRQQYGKLNRAIEELSTLPEDDAHYLDKDVSDESRHFLQFLSEINVFPPKIFPHGGDTLVFEWEAFEGIRYVTYEGEVARIRDDRDGAEFNQAAELDVRKEEDLSRLVQALGGQQWRVKHQNSAI